MGGGVSLGRIGTTLHWFSWRLEIYDRILVWISHGVVVVCSRWLKFSKFLWLRRLLGGGDGIQEGVGGDDGFFFCFVTLFTLHSDQSFLNTPEPRDSRIGTHPVRKETNASE